MIAPYVCNQLGIDFGAIVALATQAQNEIRVVQSTSHTPVAVATAYVAGRMWLKHKRMV